MNKQILPIQYNPEFKKEKTKNAEEINESIEKVKESLIITPEKPHTKWSDFKFERASVIIIIGTIMLAFVSVLSNDKSAKIGEILDKIFEYLGAVGLPLLLAYWGYSTQKQDKKGRILANTYNKFIEIHKEIKILHEDLDSNKSKIIEHWESISYEIYKVFDPNNFTNSMERYLAEKISESRQNISMSVKEKPMLTELSQIQGLMESIVISNHK